MADIGFDASNSDDSADLDIDPVVSQAKKRFQRCVEWEANARQHMLEDVKFEHGDSDNGYQWPNNIRQNRDIGAKPCLTMNIVRQHNLQITNEQKQNKSAMAFRATGNGATKESADVMSGIARRIEYQSNAQDAYAKASEFQVGGGIGWWRLVTEYAGVDTFDQDIFIREVNDPLAIYMDPDIQTKSGLDAKFAFYFDTVPRAEFNEAYPEFKDIAGTAPLSIGSGTDDWVTKSHVRVCEYFRKSAKKDLLISFMDGQTRKVVRKSRLPAASVKAILDDELTKSREITDDVVEWKLIVGSKVIDETEWPGKYIPLVRIIGTETKVDGVLDRKGHTRTMKDAQRMYNYNASAQVEFVALQSKTPWIAAAKSIEEYEVLWNTSNIKNHSVLIYNNRDDEGNEIPPPVRQEPPTASTAFESGMQTAFNQMMMTSGQWQNQMGMGGNERTGEAISQRQGQSDTATYHFADNFAIGIRTTGQMLIDLIPKVYDTKRVVKILGEDGVEQEVEIDPAAQQVFMQKLDRENKVARRVFNPTLGQYDVEAGVGPAYGTRREETVKAMTLLLTQAPALTNIIGDLLLNAMDFKEANEAAIRLKRMVPPQALGVGPTQTEQQQQQQIAGLTAALQESLVKQGKEQLRLAGKEQKRDIEVYDAETKRMSALQKMLPLDQAGLEKLIRQLVEESSKTTLEPITAANADDLDEDTAPGAKPNAKAESAAGGEAPPVAGARKAPDGNWYLADPTRPGKYLQVNVGTGGGFDAAGG